MLNFERLRVLHAVAGYGSVNAAAGALHVTNSAVSQQIARLEEELGQPLLERSGRGVRLTDAAELLVSHASEMLSLLERAEAEFDAQRSAILGQITVAAFPTSIRGLAPQALQHLAMHYPDLRVVIQETEPQQSVPLLHRGDVDVVIAQDWVNAPLPGLEGLSRAPLMDDVADIALPSDHRLARRPFINLNDLRDERWITWQAGSTCHDWLLFTVRSHGHEPVIAHTAGEHATQLALVAAGLGVCIHPRLGRHPAPKGVRLVPVRPALCRHVYALWRDANTRRRAVRVTVDAFREAAVAVGGDAGNGLQ